MTSTNQHKFQDRNPVQRTLVGQFQRKFLNVLQSVQPQSVLEAGCGEGYLLDQIHRRLPQVTLLGLDADPQAVAEGRRLWADLPIKNGDIYRIDQPDQAWDVTVASEVLEHLHRPLDALAELKRVARRYVILSVPHEPWFRLGNLARGRHLRRLGNHPEHVNLWSRKSFVRFVSQRLTPLRVTSAFPWTIVLAKP